MRRGGIGTFPLGLLLGLGLAAPALADDPPDDGESRSGLNFHWASWMQDNARPAPKKRTPPPDKSKSATAPTPAPPKKPTAVDRANAEEKVFFRRLGVCDELRRVAIETHDEALERQVDQLERRAWALYNLHAVRLSGRNKDGAADERMLDRRLGGKEAAGETGSELYTTTGSDRGSQAAIGEGK